VNYVNLVEPPNKTGAGELNSIFRDIGQREEGRFLPIPRKMSWRQEFDIKDIKAKMTISVEPLQLAKTGKNMLKYELGVKGPLSEPSLKEMEKWCDEAHFWIVNGFEDLTTSNMHAAWEKV